MTLLCLLLCAVVMPNRFGSKVEAVRTPQTVRPEGALGHVANANRPSQKDVRSGTAGAQRVAALKTATAGQTKTLSALQSAARVPLVVRYNGLTGTPRAIFSYKGYLSAPRNDDADAIARDFLTRWKGIFRFDDNDLKNLQVKSRSYLPDTGTTVIVYAQEQNGIEYYKGDVLVNVNREGQIMFAGDDNYPQLKITNNVTLTPGDAIVYAAREMGLDYTPKPLGTERVRTSFGAVAPRYVKGERFAGGGTFTDEIVVTRTIFPLGDTGRAAYKFRLVTPQFNNDVWEVIVDAQTGEVLHRFTLTTTQTAKQGRKSTKLNGFAPTFGDPGGGTLTSRRGMFRPDVQTYVESLNAAGTARGMVFDAEPTALSGRRTCTGNPPGTNCTSTTGVTGTGYGRSPARGTPPAYQEDDSVTDRNNGRGFKRSLVRARTENPYAEVGTPLFSIVYNTPFAQLLRGFPDAQHPSLASPFGWFYLPTGGGGTEITNEDDNRATTKDYGYNMDAEARARNDHDNSPTGDGNQPFSAVLTPVPGATPLSDGRTLSSVFESNYTEGNNVSVADDRANDDDTTKGVRGYDPSRQFTASRFIFINGYEYGGVDAVGAGPGGPPVPCPPVGGCSTVDYPASSNPDVYPDTVTLFYYNNLMHDYLYSIGFTEALFNMQQDNFGRGGMGKDGVTAQVQDGSGTDNANMSPEDDGTKPRMQMYLFTEKAFRRGDGDIDFDVVGHEHFHAVSNRAVGKGSIGCVGNGLVGEPGGQGEGWSDYIATSMTDDDAEGEYVTGEFDIGIRRLPYTNYRWAYQSVNGNGLTRRDQQPPDPDPGSIPFEVHDIGELWAATLWDMRELLIMKDPNGVFFDGNRRLGAGANFFIGYRQVQSVDTEHPINYRASFGDTNGTTPTISAANHIVRPVLLTQEGNRNGPLATAVRNGALLSDTLVMRGMQLSPCNPSFVDSRDSILAADKELTGGENRAIIWRAFASHGVGQNAQSNGGAPEGATGPTVVEDFTVPAGVTQCEQLGPLPAPAFTLANPVTSPNRVEIIINGGTPVAGAARYLISRASNPAGPFTTIADIPATQTTYTDDNGGQLLNVGQTFYYQVRATRDAEENCVSTATTQSITITNGTPITPPPVFLGVDQVLDPLACNRLIVSWNTAISLNPSADIVYDVYRVDQVSEPSDPRVNAGNNNNEPTFTPSAANRIAQNLRALAYVDDNNGQGLKLNHVYYYIVQAHDLNNGKLDTNDTGNRKAKPGAPSAPGVTATPPFPFENFETATADTRFVPPLTESGNDPQGQTPNFQRVTGVQINTNLTSATMYAPDFNPGEPAAQCGSTGGGQSDFDTQIGPLSLQPTSVMEWDQLFVTEAGFDGGLVEIRVGAPFTAGDHQPYPDGVTTFDLGNYMVEGAYNGNLDADIAGSIVPFGRRAYTGTKPLHHVRIPLEAFALGGAHNPSGSPVFIRFRMTSDALSVPACNAGWFIDNMVVNNLDPASCPPLNPFAPGDVLISEFRTRGAQGSADEFIELYNNTDAPIQVSSGDSSGGWSIVADIGGTPQTIATISDGTNIPARGHYLLANGANPGGYSLGSYPGGINGANETTATPDATYTTDIPDGVGLALFTTASLANIGSTNRIDAVGFTTEGSTLFKEGAGLPAPGANDGEYSFVRRMELTGLPRDTNDNATDFVFVSTTGALFGAAQSALGAPGPENRFSPIQRNARVKASAVDPSCTGGSTDPTSACARVRDVNDVGPNKANGTLSIRRKFKNTTNQAIRRLRFRIVDITTLNHRAAGDTDLRALDSPPEVMVRMSNNTMVPLEGTTIETPPAQPMGGGFNSSMTVGTITMSTPLSAGATVNVQFLLGVNGGGTFRFFVNVEALP
jgi:hypothetical protein